MSKRHNTLLRAAARIYESYLLNQPATTEVDLLQTSWDNYQRLTRRLAVVRRRGWKHAEQEVRECLTFAVRHLRNSLESTWQRLSEPRPTTAPSLRQIYDELMALEVEFAKVAVDLKETTVTITTEPITLEEVYLGAFNIVLNWRHLGATQPYSIRAVDPQPAASNSAVTHPHVDTETLCEGEGHAAIRGALAEGRLLDFFLVVRQILSTYNDSSPFVSLESWFSSGCDDCGCSIGDDGGYSCEKCDRYVCDGCNTMCDTCDGCFCFQCSSQCYNCSQWFCNKCVRVCTGCSEAFCKECMNDDQCSECREAEEPSDVAPDQSSPNPSITVHPVRVGQVAVPA